MIYLDPERIAIFNREFFPPLAMEIVDPGVVVGSHTHFAAWPIDNPASTSVAKRSRQSMSSSLRDYHTRFAGVKWTGFSF
jgi:hypothetical protein